MKTKSFFRSLLRTIVAGVLLALIGIGFGTLFDLWWYKETKTQTVTVETPLEAATRKAHEANPVYDLSRFDDDELRVLKTGFPGPSTVILHGNKIVFRDDFYTCSAKLLPDQLSGESRFIWDPTDSTLLDANGKVCFHYGAAEGLELEAVKYGNLLALYDSECCMNHRYMDYLSLRAVVDFTTGEALPLPENTRGFFATEDRMVFTCYHGESPMDSDDPKGFCLIVQDYAGNTLYTMQDCLVDLGYDTAYLVAAPWARIRRCRTEDESEELWFNPLTQEESTEMPVNEPELPEGAECYQSNGGYTAYFFPDNTVWVKNEQTGVICGKVQLDSGIAESNFGFLTWTEDGRAIFSVLNRSSHSEDIVDHNGTFLISGIGTLWGNTPLPAGVFMAMNNNVVGWMDINGNWIYCEKYL